MCQAVAALVPIATPVDSSWAWDGLVGRLGAVVCGFELKVFEVVRIERRILILAWAAITAA